jgi:hypothetical protein
VLRSWLRAHGPLLLLLQPATACARINHLFAGGSDLHCICLGVGSQDCDPWRSVGEEFRVVGEVRI